MKPTLVIPCSVCGYHAPESTCPHCNRAPSEPSLAGPAPSGWSALVAGLRAMPMGIWILLSTRRVKRLLLPPLVLTMIIFTVLFLLAWRQLVSTWDELVQSEPWTTLLSAGTFFVALIVFAFVFVWTFSIVYQAVAGPFFDTIQGRLEKRWFGSDPRATLHPSREIKSASTFARWLFETCGAEVRTLFVSVQASIVAGLIMVLLVWTIFIPFIGFPTFNMIAGFASAITLIDIPCSRRDWSLRQRLRFVFRNFWPVLALGITTSLLFLVPFLGPILGVPSAAVGGLWLVCRLDKSKL
ncbi:MAG: EI24 domain-containing protein [Planctomycetes bacterium]|nr:EI24 domain-containing protein [Planctomycetota bacterium]